MAVSELNLIFACKDFNCVTDGIWILGDNFMRLEGMVCFMLAVEATLLILMVVLLGSIQWVMLGFFRMSSRTVLFKSEVA